jgi:hypothetical protein
MKTKFSETIHSAFFNPRNLLASALCLASFFIALGAGLYSAPSNARAQTRSASALPDVVQLVGPVRLDQDLRSLPYIPSTGHILPKRLTPHLQPETRPPAESHVSAPVQFQSLLEKIFRPAPTMPLPLLTFAGINYTGDGNIPPDTNGDVGPNHYLQSVNVSFRVFDKSGNPLTPVTTFNSFFAPLTGTPCGSGQFASDPYVLYDQIADRWVVSDLAAFSLPGSGPFYECIGVSQTGDPVTGGWFLYALQPDSGNPSFYGDYPKFALWNNPQPGGAYYVTVSLYDGLTFTFQGMRVLALDRGSMLTGGSTNVIAFTVPAAAMPDTPYLFAADFRTGNPPPAGRDEFLLAIDWPANGGVIQTQVHGWSFHADFINPANSTFGIGPDHQPNAEITVNPFVDAFTDTTELLVPQQGTSQKLDTLGPIMMPPVVYQNRSGTESLWGDHTVILNYPNGPTAIRWYQFDVTGGNFPATPVQQEDWTNGGDGLWRWMPSIAVDENGNTAIGYSTSSPSIFPGIRYAGRLAGDPPNDLGQGEAIMTNGGGAQLTPIGRWGDYSTTTIDPADGLSFWHTNEYYVTTSNFVWSTRVGKFRFPRLAPTPRPRPTPAPRS